jgi:hypothetical protein
VPPGWEYWTKFEPQRLLRDIYRDWFSIFIRSARKKAL